MMTKRRCMFRTLFGALLLLGGLYDVCCGLELILDDPADIVWCVARLQIERAVLKPLETHQR